MNRIIFGFFFLLTSVPPCYQAQTPFYQGKSIKLVVGSPAGSNYDQYGRLIAPYLSKHIAGNPEVVVQNIGGAGSVIAANQVYRVAAPDGLTLVSILPAIYLDQLVGRKEVQFDYAKFTWIGSTDRSNNLLIMRADTPFKTTARCARLHPGPEMRSHRHRLHRLLHAKAFGGDGGNEI